MVDASVVAVRDATQTLFRCSICDDVEGGAKDPGRPAPSTQWTQGL